MSEFRPTKMFLEKAKHWAFQNEKRCRYCKTPESKLRCAKCKVSYCSRDCQVKDYPKHKALCNISHLDGVETLRRFLREAHYEFASALATPLNLLTSTGRSLKSHLTHVIMLEYTFDPRPDQLQRRYRIERGGLVNIDDLCAIAGTAEQSAQMRYAVSKAAMELIRDPTCEAIEGEARKNGEEFIRVPIYFKNMHPITLLGGRARIILPISLVLLKDEYGRQGEEDWIIGLESDLAVPAALGPLQTISRFSARQHMRSLIAGELGQETSITPFASATAAPIAPAPSAAPLALPTLLQNLIDSPLRCNPRRCLAHLLPLPPIALTAHYQGIWRAILIKALEDELITMGRARLIREALEESIDVEAIVQSIIFAFRSGGISIEEMTSKKFGDSLGSRLVLETWYNSPRDDTVDETVARASKLSGIYSNLDISGCLHDTLSPSKLHFIEENMSTIDSLQLPDINQDLAKRRLRLVALVQDLLEQRVISGKEWENKSIWVETLHRILDVVYNGMDSGVRSLVEDPKFFKVQKDFFARYANPLALMLVAANDLTAIHRLGLSVNSDFISRGGLLGVEEDLERREREKGAQRKKRDQLIETKRMAREEDLANRQRLNGGDLSQYLKQLDLD